MQRAGPETAARVDPEAVEIIEKLRAATGDAFPRADRFPRIGLFLLESGDPSALRAALERIPKVVDAWLTEVVVMWDRPGDPARGGPGDLLGGRSLTLQVHRNPRHYGHGGARKAAFEYALRNRFDWVILMRGDGTHPPEALPALLRPALVEGHAVVFGSRRPLQGQPGDMPRGRLLAHRLASGVQNRLLGLRLHDYMSSFRVYASNALAGVPFQLDSDDRSFDAELVLQLRALGAEIAEVPLTPPWREDPSASHELCHVLRAWAAAVAYRLHQLHLTRDGRYLVDHGVRYTLKQSETGSHMQIVSAIRPGSRVLDLGCSQGLLARPLKDKGVQVTGVDARPPRRLAAELAEYFQGDLEQALELPAGRVFDYVVVADVIEHLRDRQPLLRSARRYLKEDGRLLISTPNIALWFYRLSLLAGRFEYGPRGVLDRSHVHLFTRATFRREVEKAGFHVLRERVTALPFELVFESTGRSRLVHALARSYHALARLWPEMFAYQLILEAEITTLDEDATASAGE